MNVRCKLHCHINPGADAHMTGVYEGSKELQSITENAIFGEATPAAWGAVGGLTKDALKSGEDYYIDLAPQLETGDYLATLRVQRTYRNAVGPDRVMYRFVSMAGDHASLELQVVNPPAIAALDKFEEVSMGIKLARGRKSDAEIALRRRALDHFVLDNEGYNHKTRNPQFFEQRKAELERQLRIAEGADD